MKQGLEANRTRKFTRKFGQTFVTKVLLMVPFLSLNHARVTTLSKAGGEMDQHFRAYLCLHGGAKLGNEKCARSFFAQTF